MADAKAPVEKKVWAASRWSLIASGVVLGVLGAVSDANLAGQLPDWLAVPAGAALTAAVTYWRAYEAPHSPR
jgi:hypothetical protein